MWKKSVHPRGPGAVAVHSGDDVRYDRRWFGDDVAVDFPSAAHATERVRSTFLSHERPPATPASLVLTPDEARQGVSVFLDVPLRYTCRGCGGRGESWGQTCEPCDGSGAQLSVERFRVRVPSGVDDGTSFRFSLTPRHHPTTRVELRIRLSSARE
ncbi:MAG TPA: hypothetical protein VIY56_16095 [Vicinamibacterales bacterium]